MYIVDEPVRSERKPYRAIVTTFAVITALGGGVFWWLVHDANSSNQIRQSTTTPIVSKVEDDTVAKKLFDEPEFYMKLPEDWELTERHNSKNGLRYLQWQQQSGSKDRWLRLYIDSLPGENWVNRLLPIIIKGDRFIPAQISDNCTTFTVPNNVAGQPKIEEMPSKWQNVPFICDLGRDKRNVIGTGAVEVGNAVPITGQSGNTHTYYFVYTDQNTREDTTIFTNALKTFVAK